MATSTNYTAAVLGGPWDPGHTHSIQAAQYNSYPATYAGTSSTTYTIAGGGGGGGGLYGAAVGIAPIHYTQLYPTTYQQQYNNAYQLPAPTGIMVQIAWSDPNSGMGHAITIDQAYAGIIQQIMLLQSQHLNQTYGYNIQQPQPKLPPMVDGDFSMDEMEQAEQIMEELGVGAQ